MGKRQKEWASRVRNSIFNVLGRLCVKCGCDTNLEFDVIVPFNNDHHNYDWSKRMTFYRRQLKLNNLQVLCNKCNSKKGNQLQLNPQLLDNPKYDPLIEPF